MSRDRYGVNWAFAFQNALDSTVGNRFPNEEHRWPLLREFQFDWWVWKDSHVIVVMRDKKGGTTAGPGSPKDIDPEDCPTSPPTPENIDVWLAWMDDHFQLGGKDAAFIVPIYELNEGPPGPQAPKEEYEAWSEEERTIWRRQLEAALTRHFYTLKGFDRQGEFFLPPGYEFLADQCASLFRDHPDYARNVFLMTRFERGNRLLETLDSELRSALRDLGFNPIRADDKMYMPDRNLWNNICVYMLCCRQGVAILEDRVTDEFNPNVALEYGFMRALNKPTLLLADVGFRNLRADVVGTLREEFDITDIGNTIRAPLQRWATEV